MADPYIGEIRVFAGNYAPLDWAFCDGQRLPVSEYAALYSLIGNRYGGDTQQFCLPDLRGRVPVGQGQRPGQGAYVVGTQGGAESVALSAANLPPHTHMLACSSQNGDSPAPQGAIPAAESGGTMLYATGASTEMPPTGPSGNNAPHDNMQPWLAMRFIICLNGLYPTRD